VTLPRPDTFLIQPLRRLLAAEAYEPLLSWGARMALASVGPVVWGTLTGHLAEAQWTALTAQAICWVELKSSAGARLRVLLGGVVLAVVATAAGSLCGSSFLLSVLGMLAFGAAAGFFKNLGERGAGLSISVYVLFIIAVSEPTASLDAWTHRIKWVAAGGLWNAAVGMAATVLAGEVQPARRAVAGVWRAAASLAGTVARGWDGRGPRASLRTLYEGEKALRIALDSAILLHGSPHDDPRRRPTDPVAALRRTGALIGAAYAAAGTALQSVPRHAVAPPVRAQLFAVWAALEAATEAVARSIATLRLPLPALEASVEKARAEIGTVTGMLQEMAGLPPTLQPAVQTAARAARMLGTAVASLPALGGERPLIVSPSALRTALALHPRHWWDGLRLLASRNSSTARFAGRIAVASAVGMALYQGFDIPRGYWIPLTVIVVAQPYFGATLTKARDRILGTLIGGLIGGLILQVPSGLFARELALAVSSVGMVVFIRRRYSVATVFITVSLVLLLTLAEEASWTVIGVRAACTAGGAALAIAAGFLLLPVWDRHALPRLLDSALLAVHSYFVGTFWEDGSGWLRLKRSAERAAAACFDSLTRYLDEPGATRRGTAAYFSGVSHLLRIIHELNALHLARESASASEASTETDAPTVAALSRIRAAFDDLTTPLRPSSIQPARDPAWAPSDGEAALAVISAALQGLRADLATHSAPPSAQKHPA